MQTMKINSITLENFLGVQQRTQEFSKFTVIKGKNGKGKTTVREALSWAFFDKNSLGNKLDPRPRDKDNNVIHNVVVRVVVNAEVDGTQYVFEKSQKEQWNREKTIVTGNPTSYKINGTDFKKGEFEKFVSELIDEQVFLFASVSGAFNRLKNTDRRKTLFEKLSKVTNDDAFTTSEEFAEKLKGLLIKPVEEVIKSKKSALNQQKKVSDTFEPRIAENEKKRVEVDIDGLTQQKQTKELELAEVQQQIADSSSLTEKSKSFNKEIMDIQLIKAEIQKNLNADLVQKKSEFDKRIFELEQSWAKKTQEQSTKRAEKDNHVQLLENENDRLNAEIDSKLACKEELKQRWYSVKKEKFDQNSTTCPTCGQTFPTDKIEQMVIQFNDNQKIRLEKITEQGQQLNSDMETVNKIVLDNIDKIKQLESDFKAFDDSIIAEKDENRKQQSELKKQLTELPQAIDHTEYPQWKELDGKEQELLAELSELGSDDSYVQGLIEKQNSIQSEINQINIELRKVEDNKKLDETIAQIKQEQRENAQKCADLAREIDLLERFNKVKAEMVAGEIDAPFKHIKWKLFETQQNGEIKECCECMLHGVAYNDASHGEKMLMDLDIVGAFQSIYNVDLPVFIDDSECLDKDRIPQFIQTICLEHTDDESLVAEFVE